ncbi:Polysaccharide biosynthesis/export protein [Rubripirellula tenax]|uniref:Polysaccharide biosynthesis/export protein n=2 Tax=Rubripirellula tenax TaxID=2528015 RepID=A0A5C6FKY9_9BACT|nr:Polysaccharide biosynthesis/export protein [Rubripirellula tenax]
MLFACAVGSTGCQVVSPSRGRGIARADHLPFENQFVPRELDKVTASMYRIEPPDILTIDVQQNVSQAKHELQAGDIVSLNVNGAFPDEPIFGDYQVGVGGEIELGFTYGLIHVAGQTTQQATRLVEQHLASQLRSPVVSMSLRSVAGIQPISGEHIVGPDGTVTLGQYGSVQVAGLTLDEARGMIASQLSGDFVDTKVSVSVFAYNSKAIYVVTQGGGLGDALVRLPYTGNETVMDALAQINGTSYVSSSEMWIARPNRESDKPVRLPIDWEAITQNADVRTNYQLLPGDRVFIAHSKLVAFDSAIAKFTSPLERILGFTLLGTGTASRLSGNVLDNKNLGGGFAQ